MKIGISTLYVVPGGVGGAEYYLVNLLDGLFRVDRENTYVLFVTPENEHLYRPPSDNFRKVVLPFSNRKRILRILFEQLALPYLATKEGLDILHSPNNMAPLVKNCGSVLTIQSLHSLLYKDAHKPVKRRYLQAQLRISSRMADHVITPSEAAKEDAVRLLHLPRDKVSSILDYVSVPTLFPDGFQVKEDVLERYGIRTPYIFSPSSMYRYKNIEGILRTLKTLRESYGHPHTLVVAGRDDLSYYPTAERLSRELGLESVFQYLGQIPHDEVPALYHHADVTFFPTYCETFGIPVLESMGIGTPVVCSNRSSLPEVAGEGAVLVDPDNVEEMCRAIHQIITEPDRRDALIRKGRQRSGAFSCEQAARATLRIYGLVFEQGSRIKS